MSAPSATEDSIRASRSQKVAEVSNSMPSDTLISRLPGAERRISHRSRGLANRIVSATSRHRALFSRYLLPPNAFQIDGRTIYPWPGRAASGQARRI